MSYNLNTWEGRLAAFVSAAQNKAGSEQEAEVLLQKKIDGRNIGTTAMSSSEGLVAARKHIGLDRR